VRYLDFLFRHGFLTRTWPVEVCACAFNPDLEGYM